MPRLGTNRYGKAEVRVVRVARGDVAPDGTVAPDVIRDWNVSTSLSGALAESHLRGDNSNVLTTDTQKNTVFAFAQRLGAVEPEVLALELARHFVSTQSAITRARVAVEEFPWTQLQRNPHSFTRSGEHVRTVAAVHDDHAGDSVVSGVRELVVLNTTGSEFWGFPKDQYTTLPETTDRVLATEITASWRYRDVDLNFERAFIAAKNAVLTAFAGTYSYSLQQTLYSIGEQILADVPQACEVRLALPNRHHFLVDLGPFGLNNDNEVYYAADRPYGLIEGQVLADDAPVDDRAWI